MIIIVVTSMVLGSGEMVQGEGSRWQVKEIDINGGLIIFCKSMKTDYM